MLGSQLRLQVGRRVASRQAKSRVSFHVVDPTHAFVGSVQAPIRSRSFYAPPAPFKSVSTIRSQPIYRFSSRHLSTTNTQEGTSKGARADSIPLQANSNGKAKAKVELRPGPVKPSSKPSAPIHTTESASKTSTKPHPTKPPPPTGHEEATKAAPTDEADAGVVETAKRDVEDATKHGILAPPPAGAGVVRRFMHQAWQLFKFYIAGLKLILTNGKEVKSIRERVSNNGSALTWREHRFIRTFHSDRNKLVPFVLTIVILEEIIPLIVIYAPGLLPSTCILPSQRERILTKRHEKQRQVYTFARLADIFKGVDQSSAKLSNLDEESVNVLCSTVGLSSTGIFGMQRRRLSKYLQTLADEDAILLAESNGAHLRSDELLDTLWERGIIPDALSVSQQRKCLEQWLDKTATSADASPEETRVRLLIDMHKSS